jgi:magnesium transporter
VITTSKQKVKIIDELKEEIFNLKNSLFSSCEKSSARLVYYILDKLILNDYEIINKLENNADTLEIHIIKNPDKQFLNALLHLRHQVHTLRRCITPLRYIGDNLICNENKIIEDECLKAYSQINSKIDKLIFSMESLVSYISLVREAFEAEIANKTNEIMKLFTIVSMFFSPLMLITGIYNMNFNIPEYKWRYGYIYVLALMLLVCAILYRYFKKKGWL